MILINYVFLFCFPNHVPFHFQSSFVFDYFQCVCRSSGGFLLFPKKLQIMTQFFGVFDLLVGPKHFPVISSLQSSFVPLLFFWPFIQPSFYSLCSLMQKRKYFLSKFYYCFMMSSPDFWILTTWLENEFLLHSKRPRLDEATQLKWRNVAFYRILIKAFTLNFIVGYLKKK